MFPIPPLPQPDRQQIPAQIGGTGPLQAAPPSVGMMKAAQNPAAQVAQGLDMFMKNYLGSKDALQQHYDQRATHALQMIQQGLLSPSNADMEKIAKWMRLADWPVRTEAPTSHEKQWLAQAEASQQAQQGLASVQGPPTSGVIPSAQGPQGQNIPPMLARPGMLPNAPQPGPQLMPPSPELQQLLGQGTAAGMAAGPMAQPPSGPMPPAPRPNFLQRLGLQGRGPTAGSPAVQYLQQLAQASQAGAPMNPANVAQAGETQQIQNALQNTYAKMEQNMGVPLRSADYNTKQQLAGLMQAAIGGDSGAIGMMIRNGMMKGLSTDELTLAGIDAGMDPITARQHAGSALLMGQQMPMFQMLAKMSQEYAPRFAWVKDYGGNADAAASQYLHWKMFGGPEPQFKPSYTVEEAEKLANIGAKISEQQRATPWNIIDGYAHASLSGNQDLMSRFASMMGPPRGSVEQSQFGQTLQKDWYNSQTEAKYKTDQINMQLIRSALDAAGMEGKEIEAQINSKDPIIAQAGLQRLQNLDLKKYNITIPLPGGVQYHVSDPVDLQGAAHWYSYNYLSNQPPFLAPTTTGVAVPNQGNPYGTQQPIWQSPRSVQPQQPGWQAPPSPLPSGSVQVPRSSIVDRIVQLQTNPQFKSQGFNSYAGQNWLNQQPPGSVTVPGQQDQE